MPGIALPGASKGRLRPSFFFLLAAVGTALAQQPVYRCGQEYTNAPPDPGRCERLNPQAVTVIPGTRVQSADGVPAAASLNRSQARMEAGAQRQRDDMARAILVAELDKARQRHAALQLDHRKAEEKTSGTVDEVQRAQRKAAVERAQRDIDSLQRELERRPPAVAQP